MMAPAYHGEWFLANIALFLRVKRDAIFVLAEDVFLPDVFIDFSSRGSHFFVEMDCLRSGETMWNTEYCWATRKC